MIPFDKREGKIWYNGDLVEWQDAQLHVISHGLHYASLVFEGLRVYEGEIFKLEEHTDRLFYSAKRLDIEIPYSKDEINKACNQIIKIQKVQNGYVRPFAWRGSEMMGVSAQKTKIHVAVATWEWGDYFDPKLKTEGIKLNISNWRRPAPNTIPWDSKAAGLYMICTLSKHEAERQGYSESLMLDHEDNVAESTSANIFFKDKKGELHTPTPDSFLNGITRQTVIELAKSKNIKVHERKIKPEELQNFEGCFLTGTAAEITPISQIAENNYKVCDLILDLSASYGKLVRKKKAA